MAYFVDFATTATNAAAAGTAANMPAHQTDDILIAVITADTGASSNASSWGAVTGITNPATGAGGNTSYIFFKKATSSSETFTFTTADAYVCGIYCFRDVDPTTPFDGVTPNHSVAAASYTASNVSVNSGTNDALVFYALGQDAGGNTPPQILSNPGVMFITQQDSNGTTATTLNTQAAAWYVQRTAGAVPAASWVSNNTGSWTFATIILRNKSGGRVPAYIDDVTSPATMLHGGHYTTGATGTSWTTNGITATINSKTATPSSATLGTDFGINPFCSAITTAAAQTATTALVGPELTLTNATDMSAALLMGSFIAGSPKMATFGIGTLAQGGVVVRVGSGAAGTTAWNAYQVSSKDAVVTTEGRCVFAIEAGYAGSAYATGAGGSASASAVKYVQFLRNAPSFSSTVYMAELHLVGRQVIAGGDATNPVTIADLPLVGKSFRLPVIQAAGPAGIVSFAPIQIGGGDAVNLQIDACAIEFPERASVTKKNVQYHASDNKCGLYLAGKSGDTIKITNSVVTSPTPYVFEVTSGATNAATWDLSGLVVVNAAVTLRNVMTFNNMAFSACTSLDFSGVTMTSCKINKVPTTNASVTTSGTTSITGTSIDVSQVASGNHWWSGSDPSIFHSCSFTGGGGHAMNITASGGSTVTLDGCTFTGFGVDGSNGAALNFTATTGTITLQITNGGGTPSIKKPVGLTVNISNPKTLTFTGFEAGSDIVVTQSDTNTELLNVDAAAGPTYAWNHNYAGVTVDIRVMKAGKMPWAQYDFTLPSVNQDFTVAQVTDRAYQ